MKNLLLSFRWAFEGIFYAVGTQRNLRIHLAVTVAVTVLALVLGLSLVEWAVLGLTISFVISMEMINTSVEEMVNILSPSQLTAAKRAKDVAAAAVLVAACGSVFIGLFLFAPKLFGLIFP